MTEEDLQVHIPQSHISLCPIPNYLRKKIKVISQFHFKRHSRRQKNNTTCIKLPRHDLRRCSPSL